MSDTHAHDASFVRETMLPEAAPPATQTGVIKWVRENLFSSWLNTLLTIISLYVIYYVLSHTLGWMLYGIWDAGSLSECREIRDEIYGADASVACWAVLADRWDQLLFGFYPQDLYWRPVLALLVFFVAVAPILFENVPRKLFYVTAVAPFLCFWLIWGGSIWTPIAVAIGFVIGGVIIRFGDEILGSLGATIAGLVVPILYWLFLAGPVAGGLSAIAPIEMQYVASDEIGGFMLAIIIGVTSIILSFPLGIVLALGRQSDLFIINKSCVFFIEVIRSVPLIVWLFTASLLLNYFLPPGTNFDLLLRVIIMVTFFASAYMAEVIRGGLAALPRGQYEGADSLGLNYWQSMQLIILPQALKISIPGIVNTFIGVFKDTTLVVFVGLSDPIGFSNLIRATTDWNGIYWELFIFIGACFFICCFAMSKYSQFLERKLRTDHR
ncbi:ABC transporter permease subunit [Roseobacter sp. HKCCD9010]|uniref:amino acid ABC transporter permease n=1 Tax=unclassified Roseobacter TaxID=196798 RepID=UPI0014926CC8|nr:MULTISPECIES: amino acid ABC transporter permease [unclassified Roseobacter]MBF9051664.1 ABC transporter permease subunit [Rhodobacterales bacterium HKCCD4356]NNV13188.1 ABC transporter permease subunit [Roseobacter sp. HKCCD7357]NNV17439.1 ABC transporter permease subunit [Roseobacter sp. HKCCD8768]NNV27045.1 ABC transporter permease subunit [Roseobacter sp. HKCCD8192]NNV31165.1 ABC transporter permease subunit [Roseobacter sp. HKCCD9061]